MADDIDRKLRRMERLLRKDPERYTRPPEPEIPKLTAIPIGQHAHSSGSIAIGQGNVYTTGGFVLGSHTHQFTPAQNSQSSHSHTFHDGNTYTVNYTTSTNYHP